MVSERRNELLADLLHRVHFIEKWGRGISLMLSKEPQALLKEVGSHFIVVFKRKVLEKVTENQQEIIRRISGNSCVTISDLAKSVGISERKIRVNIAKLKKKNILRRIGPDRGGIGKFSANRKHDEK